MIETQDIQALVFSGHGRRPAALAVGLTVRDPAAARACLRQLALTQVSFGLRRGERAHELQLLVSAAGIAALSGPAGELAVLNRPFVQGMATPQRSRALGDARASDPAHWGWHDRTVHVILLIYTRDRASANLERDRLVALLAPGWAPVFDLPLRLPSDNREPFGFRDGIASARIDLGDGSGAAPGFDLLPPGEILLGQPTAGGTVDPAPPLGVGGAYVVVRQLEQDVNRFWRFWLSKAKDEEEAVWLAAKAVGRWPNGMPVTRSDPGPQPAGTEGEILRALSFHRDRAGAQCPFGAHIRRANPRDGLDDDPGLSRETVSHHRILRRGRTYGAPAPAGWYPKLLGRPEPDPSTAAPGEGRGLLFLCLCADIARQFEFVQQTWLNNPKFADLYDEPDALTAGEAIPGDGRRFSIPRKPIRRRIAGLQRFVTVRAGGYFLLPGRRALQHLLEG